MPAIPKTLLESCGRQLVNHIIRQCLLHAHHLLHEAPVDGESWQQGENAIPVQKVVVNAPADETEHVSEDLITSRDPVLRNFQNSTKLAVDSLIGGQRERECERSCNTAVAFRDVAVVPDIAYAIRVWKVVQRGYWAGLKEIKVSILNDPFDVLWASQASCDSASHRRDVIRLLVA